MSYNQRSGFGLPSSWLELNVTALDFLLAVTLLRGSMSIFAAATGEPETMALVALAGVTVVLLVITFVRLSERLRTNRMALP